MSSLLKDRYELVETLGLGGEARVAKAVDHQHNRLVVLKIRTVRDVRVREELLGEARILLAVSPHPSLPLVREDFFDGDTYVVAMDWVDGTDLARLLRQRGRPGLAPSSVLAYLAQAAQALTHLHTQDPPVIHGDVKPANLILTKGGQIKLVDFGLSSAPDAPRRRTGTPGFRAPELAADGTPSRASDVYALAATAFALLTGSAPSGVLPSWEGIDADQAEQLEGAIRMGLATDPGRRPATPGELVERLRTGWGAALPTGLITFCLSDIEGSTAMWDSDPVAMAEALVRHDELIADHVESHGGRFLKSMGEGDSTVSVFHSAPQALDAALAATRALAAERWPNDLRVAARFGIHTGEAERRGTDYFGPTVNLAARLRGQADGGQVFLSSVSAELVGAQLPAGCELVDIGPHRLKGLAAPERIHAVKGPGVDAPLPVTDCPYRGLVAFEAEDREFFFGREEVVGDLLARLTPGRLVALVGASGSGKSSVLRAGLAAAVEAGEVDHIDRVSLVTPGADARLEVDGSASELVLVDQFEEVFTACEDPERRRAFIDALLRLDGPVVIGARTDLYGQLSTHPDLAHAVADNQILLGAMTDAELQRAVTEPAALAGLRLEPGLVDLVLRDVAGEPGALPLLSHALRATWERRDGRTLTVEGYRESGGVASAVGFTADRLVDSLPAEQRPVVRRLFLRLTELGDGIEDSRRRARIDELTQEGVSPDAIQGLLDKLATARLVTLGEDTAEVAHEVLIREWPTLRQWLDEDREGIRLHRRLGNAARLWEAGGKETSDLYRGARLGAALEWAEVHRHDLNVTERDFLEESRQATERDAVRQRKTNRRLRGLLFGATALLVVASLAVVVALVQRGNARGEALRSDAQRLGTLAATETSLDRSFLLGVAGLQLSDLAETRGDLLGVLQGTPAVFRVIRPSRNEITALAASPDGRVLATGDSAGVVRFDDIRTWQPSGRPVRLAGEVSQEAMALSPDGESLAVATATPNNRANLYLIHLPSRRTRRISSWPSVPASEGPPRFTRMAFSPDGERLAVAVATAAPGLPFPAAERLVMLAAPGGRILWQRNYPLRPYQQEVSVAFTPQGALVSSAAQGSTLLWDAETGRIERSFPIGGPFGISPDGRSAALAQNNPNPADPTSSLAVLDLRTGGHRSLPPLPARAWIISVAYTPDGESIVSASFEGALRRWDATTGSIVETFAGQPSGLNLAVVRNGRTVLSGGANGSVAAWDLSGARRLGRTFSWGSPDSGCPTAPCFVIDPTSTLMATNQADGRVALIDLRTRRVIGRLPSSDHAETDALAFLPDGRRLVTGDIRGRVKLWDVRARTAELAAHFRDPVWWVAVSPDGQRLAVQTQAQDGSDSRVEVRDLASARVLFTRVVRHGHGGLYFSPNGRTLAALGCCDGGSTIEVWDARSGKPAFSPRVSGQATTFAFSPDGRVLGAGTADGKVALWDASNGERMGATFQVATGAVDSISFSPDGRLLAASSGDQTATLWDLRSRKRLGRSFPVPQGVVPVAQFARDGDLVIANLADASIWPTDPRKWERFACRVVGRDITSSEWNDVLPDRPSRRVCR
jgi:WD40 repeat protein/class 3 adenylate cyclase/tRNA A-37 threonylcarbamoyl transferase component Bud32/energy-coupling factor transporter ATP-binding protein EcfA2